MCLPLAHRELGPWFRQIGFAKDDVSKLVLHLSKSDSDFGVTNRAILFSLEEGDVEDMLEGSPLGHKKGYQKGPEEGEERIERVAAEGQLSAESGS